MMSDRQGRFRAWWSLTLCALAMGTGEMLQGAEPASPDYLREVKPLVLARCVKCHGPEKHEAGLRLDSAAGMLAGGDSGPAIVPGKPDESLLLIAVLGRSDEVSRMPPEGKRLAGGQATLLRRWIAAGAPAPSDEKVARPAGADHWAFQQPNRPALPAVSQPDWCRNPIDYFVLAKLDERGLAPSPEASRATLMRRASLDLRGVPPTPKELAIYLADDRPAAYERMIDRLLDSPAYGERWARHWLDLARYADSNGYTRDFARSIWKYRDWVIDAMNRDLPFDQFTIEQFAGDLLPGAGLSQQVATGFHRNTLFNEEGGTDAEQFRVDAVADRVDTTGSVFLGLTLGCARCHAHKYDPISQREYYQLFAFLNNCDEPMIDVPTAAQLARGDVQRRDELRRQIEQCEADLKKKSEEFIAAQVKWERTIDPQAKLRLPSPTIAALIKPAADRNDQEKKLVAELYFATDEAPRQFPLVAEILRLRKAMPSIPTTLVMRERSEPRVSRVHKRGDFLQPGEIVEPAVPAVLNPLTAAGDQPNRLDFARWLVSPANPLTPRVTVNRYWQRLFGRGLVETENDFGTQGTPPTHPGLLDWLAVDFVESGWRVKRMHRLMVTSATYRQSSRLRPELAERDPANFWLARQSRVRLEAEIIRDTALAVSGLLSPQVGGPSVHPPQPEGVFDFTQDPKPWIVEQGADRYRRGMYTYLWRSSPYPALTVFDFPEANVTCTRRVRSNTPLQSLTLANDIVFVECARALAARVLQQPEKQDAGRARYAFQLALSREPSPTEAGRFAELVESQRAAYAAQPASAAQLVGNWPIPKGMEPTELAAWTAAARVLLNLDEFITRE